MNRHKSLSTSRRTPRKTSRSTGLMALLITGAWLTLAPPRTATAAEVLQTDTSTLSVGGVVRAGWNGVQNEGRFDHGPWLGFARLNAAARYADRGEVFVQFNASSRGVQLLDARATVHLAPWLSWNVGRFKSPVSLEYLVGGPATPFSGRYLAGAIAPRRLYGTSLVHAAEFDDRVLTLEAGVYAAPATPANVQRDDLVFAARAAFEPAAGMTLHFGFAEQLERLEAEENAPTADPTRTETDYGRVVDLGFAARRGAWNLHAEVTAQVQAQADAPDASQWGFVLMGGYRVSTPNAPFDVEPILSFDSLFAIDTDVSTLRARGGVRMLWREAPINVTFELYNTATDGTSTLGGTLFGQLTL